MSHPSPSASLVSLPATEDTTVSPSASTATLLPVKSSRQEQVTPANPAKPTPPPKDYEAAFAALSSSYGFAGSTPAKNPTKASKKKKSKGKQVATNPSSTTDAQTQQGGSGQGQSAPK
ncbi:hypothetical protein ACG7TL_006035 [Trametes sanguinea]